MKNIKKTISGILLTSLLVSCGGPNQRESEIDLVDKNENAISYEELVLSYDGTSLNNVPSSLDLDTPPYRFAYQPIIISNKQRTTATLSLDLAAVGAVAGAEISTTCGADLGPLQSCWIEIYYNRSLDQSENLDSGLVNLGITIGGNSETLPMRLTTSADRDLTTLATSSLEISTNTIDYGTLYEGKSASKTLIIQNLSRLTLPIDKDLTGLSFAQEGVSTCGTELAPLRACFITYKMLETNSIANYSESITIAGTSITLSGIVEAEPVFTSNPNLNYLNVPVGGVLNLDNNTSNYTIQIENNDRSLEKLYNTYYVGTTQAEKDLEYPEAFTLDDRCDPNGDLLLNAISTCNLNFLFDPERFHFNVTFTKTISLNNEDLVLNLTGNSPCSDPSDPLYEPGTKLNSNKTACVPNLGVFDSQDSVYGHAVYQ